MSTNAAKEAKLKSIYIVEVYPNSGVDLEKLGAKIVSETIDGVEWGKPEVQPLAFGAKKLVVPLVVLEIKLNREAVEKVFSKYVGEDDEEGDVDTKIPADSFEIVSQENY